MALRHLNPMDILRNVFTSRISSRFLLTVVWIYFLIPIYIGKTKPYLKTGWSPSLTTKGGAFVY